jgi:hypothetical protein
MEKYCNLLKVKVLPMSSPQRCHGCGIVRNFLSEHVFVFHPFFMNNPG